MYGSEQKRLTFRICNYNRNYCRDEDFTRKLQIVITKILQIVITKLLRKCVIVSYEFLYYGNCDVTMALRRKLKAIEQRVKDSGKCQLIFILMHYVVLLERFYLVFWEEESNVSVHSEKELKEPLPEERVGDACSIKFGRIWYTGKIASMGKLSCIVNVRVWLLNIAYCVGKRQSYYKRLPYSTTQRSVTTACACLANIIATKLD